MNAANVETNRLFGKQSLGDPVSSLDSRLLGQSGHRQGTTSDLTHISQLRATLSLVTLFS
jgi:hypothetical protein